MRVLVAKGRISLLLVRGRGKRHEFQNQGQDWACEMGLPERQRSQDFGIAQSQLAVEQESIQFIPPHPSTSQRNQFQFRGAIQALPATQIGQRGQRGQRVGRSQGHIRVAQWKRSGP